MLCTSAIKFMLEKSLILFLHWFYSWKKSSVENMLVICTKPDILNACEPSVKLEIV